MSLDRTRLADLIAEDVAALCAGPDRQPGTRQNRAAVDYMSDALRAAGCHVTSLPFEVCEWQHGSAVLHVGSVAVRLHAGPYSPAVDATGRLLTVDTVDGLRALSGQARGAVLMLHGTIAAEQLTPRAYPWYANADHAAIYDALEALAPAAIVASTGKNPAMTAAREPFPLIEDPAFGIPTAYCARAEGEAMLAHAGEMVRIVVDSSTTPSSGIQPVGRIASETASDRVIVAGHLDSTWGSPGALDNAAGAVSALAAARLLAQDPPPIAVEIVPFNGEDHATSPGEVAYLAANPDGFDDVVLMINIDGAGFRGSPAAVSTYGVGSRVESAVDTALAGARSIEHGPEWFASDHAIFAMRGVPAIAITSRDFGELWESIAHTALDVPDNLDYELISQIAQFVEAVVRNVARSR